MIIIEIKSRGGLYARPRPRIPCAGGDKPLPYFNFFFSFALTVVLALLAALAGCHGSPDNAPTLSDLDMVVPSGALPAEVELQNANNNLDAIFHEGRFYLAFRTGPTHFASPEVVLYVLSSTDRRTWTYEAEFSLCRDLREPRLLSFDGRLFLYFAVLGTSPVGFEPGWMMATERRGPGDWTEPEMFHEEGFIAWRTKTIEGTPYMLAYKGGENIYELGSDPIEVHWLTTRNGFDWTPVVPGRPVVLKGGNSETDFVFLQDGSLLAVSRNEAGDEMGWGMKICRAAAEDLGEWECVADPKKYDSPLLFRHRDDVYLIGRRNLTGTGDYDLYYRHLPFFLQTLAYELDYWFRPKRCALWRVDSQTLSVEHMLDLPSCGDTCFPATVPLGGGRYLIYNYTSPLDGTDPFWLQGQLGPTHIYSVVLTIP